uniref:Chitin-binding type-4 domain-containing protein n=2 Tax=Bactrocera latifrons TaxID=174628 RepID=A0A0K8TUX0_BACLA
MLMSFYKQRFLFSFALVSLACIYNGLVSGHGMLLDPPGRSSRWRYNSTAPTNYDDNGLNCGGMSVQWEENNGKCGLCGDNYAMSMPRANEIGGYYGGSGVITKEFRDSYTASVGVRITTNHLGYFHFDLCNLSEFGDESENCFAKYSLRFVDGSDRLYIGSTGGLIVADLVWPEQLNCEHCVLRWTYTGGNNWGPCGNGTGALGCGPQETFVNCADISIAFPTTDSPNVYRPDVYSVEDNFNDEVPDYGDINEN